MFTIFQRIPCGLVARPGAWPREETDEEEMQAHDEAQTRRPKQEAQVHHGAAEENLQLFGVGAGQLRLAAAWISLLASVNRRKCERSSTVRARLPSSSALMTTSRWARIFIKGRCRCNDVVAGVGFRAGSP